MNALTRVLFVLACCWAVPALAQDDTPPDVMPSGECTVDADCPTGFSCESINVGVCTDCDPADPNCVSGCTSESYSYCEPPPPTPCTSDVNCADGEVCVSYSYEVCSGTAVACAPNEPCENVEPVEECETIKEAYCVPPYVAPCQADADCGPGFTCEAYEMCSCSGSTGVPVDGTDPEGDVRPTEPDCVCEPSGENYCQVIEVECTTDADCADGLACVAGGGDTIVPEPLDDSTDPDGGTVEPTPVDPAPAVSYCLPPGYSYWGGPTGDSAIAAEAGIEGDANFAGSDRVSWGTDANGGTKGEASGGCATVGGEATLSLLGLMGLFGWVRRRR